jgi:hypothetical protein
MAEGPRATIRHGSIDRLASSASDGNAVGIREVMIRQHRRSMDREAGTGGRVVAIGLVLALLSMPVNYHAGTDRAHPHSFVQFLQDAASGSMNHHLVRGESAGEHAAHPAADAPDRATASSAPIGAPVLDQLGPANERASALGLALLAALLLWSVVRSRIQAAELVLRGRSVRPASPPPKCRGSHI